MSNLDQIDKSKLAERFKLINPLPQHFEKIQELCKRVYPFHRPWYIVELESHRSYFPDGQLAVLDTETDKIVGVAFSLIISWSDYSPQDNWKDYTSAGYFHNHDPKHGKTLYGAEVMVDPEYRGLGIGKMLYEGRRQIARDYNLKRIRAGARIRNYSKHQDKLTPQEYTRKVVQRELADPTLSFQLSQGFKVIDVASNYILNDPESLGYAAVIEWINPDAVTESEIKKQNQVVDRFLNEEKFISEFLPKELRRLVRMTTTALGSTIRETEGSKFFKKMEWYREAFKKTRTSTNQFEDLKKIQKKLSKESAEDQFKLAHAFALQLEIVNVCEAAYRSWKLKQKTSPYSIDKKLNLTYVLTSHPTEARSTSSIRILNRLLKVVSHSVHNKSFFDETEFYSLIQLLWLQPLSKSRKPSVKDEAEYLFSSVFNKDIFDFLLDDKASYNLKLRTWVGGDKDGHPGVNEEVMRECLQKSRAHLLKILQNKLQMAAEDLQRLSPFIKKNQALISRLQGLIKDLEKFKTLGKNDGNKIKIWTSKFQALLQKAPHYIQGNHEVLLAKNLLVLFPGLVMPIELREDASLIKEALTNPKAPIRKMIVELEKISGVNDITNYARGLVISHCEETTDINNACKLVDLACKRPSLPVIPLFESKEALENGPSILQQWLDVSKNYDRVTRFWQTKFEVMLGYSDSSKQIGVLPSRFLIYRSMQAIDTCLKDNLLSPVFFHGSGGSVERGGGSLKDQISWWAPSAVYSPKMTIQGEMIQRLFSTKEILNSQCSHLTRESLHRKRIKSKHKQSAILKKFTKLVENEYKNLVADQDFLGHLLDATPYSYLDVLKIGSRPAKRPSKELNLSSLRAIPWVLCWTQTRSLLPSWWGVGRAWKKLNEAEKQKLRQSFQNERFFSSFIKTLGFTLEKVEVDVWKLYWDEKSLKTIFPIVQEEFEAAKTFVSEIIESDNFLKHRPWMKESIYLRSSHIHILNMLQIEAIKNNNENLLRESIVGIACGMMTTG